MNKKYLSHMVFTFCMFFFSICIVKPLITKAAPQKVVNITNQECCEFDINGDGSADTIIATTEYDEDMDQTYGVVLLNSTERVLSFSINEEYSTYTAKLISLKNGSILLYLKDRVYENVGGENVYMYRNDKFVKVGNLHPCNENDRYGGDWHRVKKISVSGNKIIVKSYFNSYSLGSMDVKYEYALSNGKLKKSPTAGWISKLTQKRNGKAVVSKTMTTKTNLIAYKTATGSQKKMTIKKGKKVYVDRLYYSSKTGMRVRVKYNKKFGWVKLSKTGGKVLFKYIYHMD